MIRGTVTAAGFILDVPTIGEREARERTLRAWSSGATLRALPDGRWLLLLSAPVTVRAERAPGLVVVRDGDTLHAGGAADPRHGDASRATGAERVEPRRGDTPGAADAAGTGLVELRHGELLRHDLATLEPVNAGAWIELPPVAALRALDAPPAVTTLVRAQPEPGVDLRATATVRARHAEMEALLAPEPPRNRGGGLSGLLAKLALRTPVADLIGRRHQEYLDQLTRAFERGDYENALRDAIALGGTATGAEWLSLRLPRRRTGELRPSDHAGGGGGTVPWDGSAYDLLRRMYLRAAERLERNGEIERAAFVHADLLHSAYDAVALLERHGQYALAARLAEARGLPPVLAVALWWQAGERRRAIALARSAGGWEAALDHVQDPQLQHELRAAWMDAERARGDHRSAIEVAWPDPVLRDRIGPDLDALRALGGTPRAAALAFAVAWREDAPTTQEALALLEPAGGPDDRLAFLEIMAEHAPVDPVTARRLAGQGVRALLRDGAAGQLDAARGGRALVNQLRHRADPLLLADLPNFKPKRRETAEWLAFTAPADRGAIELHDAVLLPAGLLVAHGPYGLRLLRPDGRELVHWEVRADQLVVADHGATVLVVAYGESIAEIRRLELSSRRLTRLAALPDLTFLDSFDGATAVAVGEGLEGIDLTEDPPRTLWSELDQRTRILATARTPTALSAIVDTPLQGRRDERSVERWTWALPNRTVKSREVHSEAWAGHDARVTASGTVVWIADDRLHTRPPDTAAASIPLDQPTTLAISGDHHAHITDGRVTLQQATIDFPEATDAGLRVHDDIATVFTSDGRLVALDLRNAELLARLRFGPR